MHNFPICFLDVRIIFMFLLWPYGLIWQDLQTGDITLVIGTHSLIAEKVEFSALRLAIVDEQQRFGVVQRGRFNSKVVCIFLPWMTVSNFLWKYLLHVILQFCWDPWIFYVLIFVLILVVIHYCMSQTNDSFLYFLYLLEWWVFDDVSEFLHHNLCINSWLFLWFKSFDCEDMNRVLLYVVKC